MKVLSVRDFKTRFGKIARDKEDVLITQRGKPLGLYQPIEKADLKGKKIAIGQKLISLGDGGDNNVSERHDEVLYE
jgi:hypothetical protein